MKVIALICLCLASVHAPEITKGKIGDAKFMIAAPEQWQGKLVLLAHGDRLEKKPLDAEFDAKDRFAAPLLEKGWCIASTSYRRNGWIVEDAIADLKALRDHVEKEHGEVKRCLVIGNSMGGLIGTLIAEGALDRVDGVVAIGAYLGDRETDGYYKSLMWTPKVPLLYLTNEDELDHPKHYRSKAGTEKTALWEVKRPGSLGQTFDRSGRGGSPSPRLEGGRQGDRERRQGHPGSDRRPLLERREGRQRRALRHSRRRGRRRHPQRQCGGGAGGEDGRPTASFKVIPGAPVLRPARVVL